LSDFNLQDKNIALSRLLDENLKEKYDRSVDESQDLKRVKVLFNFLNKSNDIVELKTMYDSLIIKLKNEKKEIVNKLVKSQSDESSNINQYLKEIWIKRF
tara:strand:- start:1280 stop:1579 length:300 start_codon:yes stop_codon:yes gene_type:complete